jgi:hypothetical protein
MLLGVMILSGLAGTVWSVYDLVLGRGVVVETVAADSMLHQTQAEAGD